MRHGLDLVIIDGGAAGIDQAFRVSCRELGIVAEAHVRGSITIYSFRHLWISEILMAGVVWQCPRHSPMIFSSSRMGRFQDDAINGLQSSPGCFHPTLEPPEVAAAVARCVPLGRRITLERIIRRD